jgi:predicted RNase H-like HicB family nuclease
MNLFRIPLRVVFFREGGDWVAHCLEFDLAGDGATKEDAFQVLVDAIAIQLEATIQHDNPKNLFSPAPAEFLEMFAAGSDIAVANLSICLERLGQTGYRALVVEGVETREYAESVQPELALA